MMIEEFPPQLQSPRYQTLDAWRGLACLMVIVFHSTFYASSNTLYSAGDPASLFISIAERFSVGVPLFFVISGYCIAATADSNRRRSQSIYVYVTRRFRRIFPPYWIYLALATIAVALLAAQRPDLLLDENHPQVIPSTLSLSNWIGTVTLTEGWLPHLVGGKSTFFLGHAWTLGYEEQFYAVTGLSLAVSRRWFFALMVFVTVVVVAVAPSAPRGFFFDGLWLHFAAGVGVYYVLVYGSLKSRAVYCSVLVAALAFYCNDLHAVLHEFGPLASCGAFSFSILLICLRPFDQRISRLWILAPLDYCGRMCYSLYLVHWPLTKVFSKWLWDLGVNSTRGTVLLTVPACLLISVVIARLFYLGVERHFLNTAPVSKRIQSSHVAIGS